MMPGSKKRELAREVRQRLEALKRAGVDRVPAPKVVVKEKAAPAPEPEAELAQPPATPPKRVEPVGVVPTASLFGETALDSPVLDVSERVRELTELSRAVSVCPRCPVLVENRTQTVFGVGNPSARLMFIGEAPGADEDKKGEPFVGRAGQLLTDMITKGMGLKREDVYIANILKCRPPGNRDPEPTEVANCIGYLERQIALIHPDFLCLLGRIAAQRLLETALPMGRMRGKWHSYRGVPTMVTYHPAALLRNPNWKKDTWEDLKMLMRAMGIKVPETRKPT